MKNSILIIALSLSFLITNGQTSIIDICNDTTKSYNSYNCAQLIEQYQKKYEGKYFKRYNSKLILNGLNNIKFLLEDDDEIPTSVNYSYRQYLKTLSLFIVHVQYYEGENYLLINSYNGESLQIPNLPIFSKDSSCFITFNNGTYSIMKENTFGIWKINNNKFENEFKTDTLSQIYSAKWINNNKILIENADFDIQTNSMVVKDSMLLIRNKNWGFLDK
jgi:hypothetical protein